MSFYILNNVWTKQTYLFTTSTDKSKRPKDVIVFEYNIENYSILDLKKLIFATLEIPVEKQHLWIHNMEISNEMANGIITNYMDQDKELDIDFGKFPETLGYVYKNETGINFYEPNLLEINIEILEKDHSEEYIDNHSKILGDYSIILYTIYFIES